MVGEAFEAFCLLGARRRETEAQLLCPLAAQAGQYREVASAVGPRGPVSACSLAPCVGCPSSG